MRVRPENIAAIATPLGVGALAIIRVSGFRPSHIQAQRAHVPIPTLYVPGNT